MTMAAPTIDVALGPTWGGCRVSLSKTGGMPGMQGMLGACRNLHHRSYSKPEGEASRDMRALAARDFP